MIWMRDGWLSDSSVLVEIRLFEEWLTDSASMHSAYLFVVLIYASDAFTCDGTVLL